MNAACTGCGADIDPSPSRVTTDFPCELAIVSKHDRVAPPSTSTLQARAASRFDREHVAVHLIERTTHPRRRRVFRESGGCAEHTSRQGGANLPLNYSPKALIGRSFCRSAKVLSLFLASGISAPTTPWHVRHLARLSKVAGVFADRAGKIIAEHQRKPARANQRTTTASRSPQRSERRLD
jgi:hypothetical protein